MNFEIGASEAGHYLQSDNQLLQKPLITETRCICISMDKNYLHYFGFLR